MKIIVREEKFKCCRCGYVWKPRDPNNVKICPKCKSARFDEPKKIIYSNK
jgi:predicted Zn-ribbon and HTH transcriptional regulator